MIRIGSALIFFGVGSFLLNLLEREFILMMWVDAFGPGIGIIIRLSMIVAGIALILMALKQDNDRAQRK